jgi:hypothetical protein
LAWGLNSVYYAGGGGGGLYYGTAVGAGGNGGGGAGGGANARGVNGAVGSGGGGGGSGQDHPPSLSVANQATGGSGVVIFAIKDGIASLTTGSPTVGSTGSYTTYTFASSGSLTI